MKKTKLQLAQEKEQLRAAFLPHLQGWLVDRFPDNQVKGREFLIRNPNRDDKTIGSFSINLDSGKWSDFASNDKGDVFDLIKYLCGVDFNGAVDEMRRACGSPIPAAAKPEPPPARPRPADQWTPIAPIPVEALNSRPADFCDSGTNYPIARWWEYRNESGAALFCIARFEKTSGKEIRPACFCRNKKTGETTWRWMAYPPPTPPYNLNLLAAKPNAAVILVEGEKTADALSSILPNQDRYVVSTWSGGSGAVPKADFSPLHGRRVLLWPDADAPGLEAMTAVCALLEGQVAELKIIRIPETTPRAWDAADAIASGWDLQRIAKFIQENATQPVNAPTEPSAPTSEGKVPAAEEPAAAPVPAVLEPDLWPFRSLGCDSSSHYFMPVGTRNIVAIPSDKLTNPGQLLRLADLTFWERNFAGGRRNGPDWKFAGNSVMRDCERRGPFDPLRVRGRGLWHDGGKTVLHLGDSLWIDGAFVEINEHRSKYVYPVRPAVEFRPTEPLTNVEASRLLDLCKMLSWENQKLAYFLAGWCVIAPICGILRWRPHVWLTGGRGTGKTWILENIIEPCLRQICLSTQGKATEAGVRQGLDSDAWPVIHDEADAHGDRGHARISDLIELARLASSDTAPAIYKGSSHGTAKIYRVRSVFCFSSINPKLEESADRSRVTILTLKKSNDETAFKRLAVAAIQTINPTWVDGLISRSIHLAESIRRNAGSFAEVLAGHLGDRRTGDQLGALLAGAYSLTSNKTISIEVAEKWVSEHDFTEEALEIADTEPRECLNRLLQNVIRPLPATERSVSELLAISNLARKMPPGDIVDEPVSHIQADQTLRRLGVKWKKDRTGSTLGWIAIGQGYEGVKGIYEKTQWRASFSRVLKRLDNRVTEASSERFLYGDIKSRAVLIPWDICFDEESE